MKPDDCLLDEPDSPKATLVLAHGAGAPMDHEWMDQVTHKLSARDTRVLRFEFPYMAQRRVTGKKRGPDRPDVLLETWREAYALGASLAGGTDALYIGGKSMGGRYATMIADELAPAGVIAFGYPFHPPGRPEKLRTEHLASLKTRALVLQGERDTFGTRDEVAAYALGRSIRVHFLLDGDHSLKPRKASGRTLEENLDDAVAAAAAFMSVS